MPWGSWRQLYLFYHFIPPWPWVIVLIFPWGSCFPQCIITHSRNMSVCMRITEQQHTKLKIMISQNQQQQKKAGKNLQLKFLCWTMTVFEEGAKLTCLEIPSYYSHCRNLAISDRKNESNLRQDLSLLLHFSLKLVLKI